MGLFVVVVSIKYTGQLEQPVNSK